MGLTSEELSALEEKFAWATLYTTVATDVI